MTRIVKEIYSDISLGSLLGFKGGTAAMMFYGLPRFSVDLDFDLIDKSKKDLVFTKINQIAERFGEVREKREKFYNLFWIISYKKNYPQIKIEIDKKGTGSSYNVKSYLGVSVLVMKKEDMFAHKLIALLDRRELANRDIYDIWYMLDKNWEVNWEIIKRQIKLNPGEYLEKCIKFLEKNPPKSILDGMGELLDRRIKEWARSNLLSEALFLLKLRLQNLK